MENKNQEDLPIKSFNGKKCPNCDTEPHPESHPVGCVGCKYDW